MLFIDIETRSQVDLNFHGLRRYAEDPSTQIICMAYAFDDDPIEFWWADQPFPKEVTDYIATGGPITAHNAEFERHLFEWVIGPDYGFDAPKLTQWRCSLVQALANGFPAGLDAGAVAVGLPYRKHAQGTRLLNEYCKTGHLKEFKPGDAELMRDYNVSDVEVMRALVKVLRPISDAEWEEYHLNCRINERGIPVDVPFCEAALAYTHEVADDANRAISDLTDGMMTKSTQRKARDAWLFPRLTADQMKLLEVYKKGEKKISLDQDHRGYLLGCDDLDPGARELLEYINNAGSSALKKFAVAAHTQVAGRVHNTFVWNGAGRTGRFSGKGLQPHNIRRDVFEDDEAQALIARVIAKDELDGPAETMARLLRAMVYSEKGLYWVDWSAIEGRVAPWLSHRPAGERKLDLYRQERDVYVVTASDMFGVAEDDVGSELRQSGKIAELSLQYGGGANALIGMAKNYGVTFSQEEGKDITFKWRAVNPWATEIWSDYDAAIENAVLNPGVEFEVGRVTYLSDEAYLWCRLPSERILAYPRPRRELYTTPWGEERVGVTFQTHFKPAAGEDPIRLHARGALLFQNTVQAVAADCLREALLEADDAGLGIIGHVHDEIIGEGPPEDGEKLNEIMLQLPWWADGLPLATGGVTTGERYGK